MRTNSTSLIARPPSRRSHAAGSIAPNRGEIDGPPVKTSRATSRPVAFVHANGSIDSRPLNAHVSVNTPKTTPVM